MVYRMVAPIAALVVAVLAPAGQQDPLTNFCAGARPAAEGPMTAAPLVGTSVEELGRALAANELRFKLAREGYAYGVDLVIQTLLQERVDGELRAVGRFGFDANGQRTGAFKTTANTLRRIRMPLGGRDEYAFELTSDMLEHYAFKWVGQQDLDGKRTLVLDVTPGNLDDRGYFQGRIWVMESDRSIVQRTGRTVTRAQGRYSPNGTEYRQLTEGRYWFPACTIADDMVPLRAGPVRVREFIRYTDYRRATSRP